MDCDQGIAAVPESGFWGGVAGAICLGAMGLRHHTQCFRATRFRALILAAGALALSLNVASASGTIYFADNFEQGLGQWQPGSGGIILNDPDSMYGEVLTFDRLWSGGDIWSKVAVPAGAYLSFDYMGFGGFIGTAGDWLAGQPGYGGLEQGLTYDNTWRHYVVQVRYTGQVMVEDFSGTAGQQSPAYFDNIVVSDGQPSIVTQPQNQTVTVETNGTFTVTAGGTPPLSYQWYFNGTSLAGQTNATLSLANVQAANVGSYTVVISNSFGSVTSRVAVLDVTASSSFNYTGNLQTFTVPPGVSQISVTITGAAGGNGGNDAQPGGATSLQLQASANLAVIPSSNLILSVGGGGNGGRSGDGTGGLPGGAGGYSPLSGYAGGNGGAEGPSGWSGSGGGGGAATIIVMPDGGSIIVGGGGGAGGGGDNSAGANGIASTIVLATNSQTAGGVGTSHPADGGGGGGGGGGAVGGSGGGVAGCDCGASAGTGGGTWLPTNYLAPAAAWATSLGSYGGNGSITITSLYVPMPPSINSQPGSSTVALGGNASFAVVATSATVLSYQWLFNGTNLSDNGRITGSQSNVLTIAGAQLSDAGNYQVIINNDYGSVTSAVATLSFPPPASIAQQPQSASAGVGAPVTMSVSASGAGPFSYQWYQNGQALSGATNATLSFTSVQASNQGSYTVVITNPGGSVTSSPPATLTVLSYCAGAQTFQSIYPAGLTVPLTVSTFDCGSLSPIPNVSATVWIYKAGTIRTIPVTTGNSGSGVAYFIPLPGETGVYQIAAGLPGQSAPAAQGTFTLVDPNLTTNQLTAAPASLVGTMVPGGQTLVSFNVVNAGNAASGNLQVLLPSTPWLSLVTTQLVASLAPGQTNQVTLTLQPATNMTMGAYTGDIVIASANTQVIVPFQFTCVSTQQGALQVTVQDELGFYSGSPGVSNATVTVSDFLTGTNVNLTAVTDASGNVLFNNLTSAYYNVLVQAPNHGNFNTTLLLAANQTNQVTAFLPMQLVDYSWVVVPTQVPDQYTFQLQVTYQTQVPWPVITIDPGVINLCGLSDGTNTINLTIANHGLIAAEGLQLAFGTNANWDVEAVTPNLGDLAAGSNIVTQVVIRWLGSATNVPSSIAAQLNWHVTTPSQTVYYTTPIYIYNASPQDCTSNPPPNPPPVTISSGDGNGFVGTVSGNGFSPDQPIVNSPPPVYPPTTGPIVNVGLQFEQTTVISRNAFNATLQLASSAVSTISNLAVTISPVDASGNPATNQFVIQPPLLTGINAVDGTGNLAAGASALASWMIVPETTAALAGPTSYNIGGTLSYMFNGSQVTIPLFAVPVTVLPSPQLEVDYFLEHDVYSDDPFTPQIEPAVPFGLGVIMRNTSLGVANNVTITSAQPLITSNPNGLLVNFQIVGSQVGTNQSVSPSLTLDLGNIGPGGSAVGLWWMTASLEGSFTDYSATFEHVDAFGQTNTSLIDSTVIHEMTHVVRITAPAADDGIPDFLVNDSTNVDAPPNKVYSSDGSVFPVTSITNGMTVRTNGNVVTITACDAPSSGWVYLELPDSCGGTAAISSVQRSDGVNLLVGPNVWQTPQRLHMVPPQPTNLIHFFDTNSTGSTTLTYTLTYGPTTITIVAATNFAMQVFEGQSGQLPVAKLINAATAPSGTSLTVSLPSSASVLGGALQLSSGLITYTPPAGIVGTTNFTDNFAYALTANSGASATGIVTVIVDIPIGSGQSVLGVTVSGGQATISFAGIPGCTYSIQASTNLVNWTVIGTATAGQSGLFQFTDINAGQYPARYYRTSVP